MFIKICRFNQSEWSSPSVTGPVISETVVAATRYDWFNRSGVLVVHSADAPPKTLNLNHPDSVLVVYVMGELDGRTIDKFTHVSSSDVTPGHEPAWPLFSDPIDPSA